MAFTLSFQQFPNANGPLAYAQVPWDTELFGFPIYELRSADIAPDQLQTHLPDLLAQLPTETNCMVVTKIQPSAVETAQVLSASGFYPVETLLEFYLGLSRLTPIVERESTTGRFRLATAADLPRVKEIARTAFYTDRFHLDKNLSSEKADLRYERWIENSFKAGESIFLWEDMRRNEVVGFVQGRDTAPHTIDTSLGAIDKNAHNSGAGVLLYQNVFVHCKAHGYKQATTRISINNLSSIKPMVRLGFTMRHAVMTLHWFRAARRST